MHIHLGRVAFGVGEGDFVALLHQGANRNRQFVEIVTSTLVTSAIFQGQAATARDQYQDFSFCCHFVLLFEIESVLLRSSWRKLHSASGTSRAGPRHELKLRVSFCSRVSFPPFRNAMDLPPSSSPTPSFHRVPRAFSE